MNKEQLKDFLETKFRQYNTPSFIQEDPVSLPHKFTGKEDREISGFLAATIAWGQRPVIIRNAKRILEIMEGEPFDFISEKRFSGRKKIIHDFCHRTFNGEDLYYFFKALHGIYSKHGGLEAVFSRHPENMQASIAQFRNLFFSFDPPARTFKHVSDPMSGSAAKRLNMFLRWMVRKDKAGVDFGIWNKISPSALYLPLDVHTGNVARLLGLLDRRQNDWKAVEEVTGNLRKFDPSDPVKYDFALFGTGIYEGIAG